MSPKEFQKSNLALELKAGKKRLEDALRGLSDDQCETARATQSGSVLDLLSEIVTREFLALMEVSNRLPNLPRNPVLNADGRTPAASGPDAAAPGRSVQSLLAEFEILRSAAIRGVEDGAPHGPRFDEKYAYVDDLCVARFNKQIDEIDRWRSSQIVGFSAASFRAKRVKRSSMKLLWI